MKYYFLAGLVLIAAVVAVMMSRNGGQSASAQAEYEHFAKKRDIAEVETKVRPASFENMKFEPGAEMRSPASVK